MVPGIPHHVTQRGNRQVAIFERDEDHFSYLRFPKKYPAQHDLSEWAFSLMSNHVDLVVVPGHEASLGRALRDTHMVYATYFNNRTTLPGHVWQARFYSCTLDDPPLWAAMRHVERDPVAAWTVERAAAHRWSSAGAHCVFCSDEKLSPDFPRRGVWKTGLPGWPNLTKTKSHRISSDKRMQAARAATRALLITLSRCWTVVSAPRNAAENPRSRGKWTLA